MTEGWRMRLSSLAAKPLAEAGVSVGLPQGAKVPASWEPCAGKKGFKR